MTTWHLLHVRFFSFSEDPLKLTLSIRTEVLTYVSKLHILRILRFVGFLLISVTSLIEFLFICLIDRHRHCARRSTNKLGEGTEQRSERKARRRLFSSIVVSLDSARSGHGLAGSESGGAADAVSASRISTPGTYRRVFHILLQHDARHLPGGSGGDLGGGSSQLALLQSPTLALAGANVRRRGERQAAEIEVAASFSQERSVEVAS
jgi:hypothetical protein